jgi:UDP-GlcNAc:undecaprenyl-phosphate GlcNAc-1-phosphate transferase
MLELPEIINKLLELVPLMVVSFVVCALLVPIVNKLAVKIGALDYPKHLRTRVDQTADRRIHDQVTPKLGGLALVITFIGVLIWRGGFANAEVWEYGVLIGLVIILVAGFLDDLYDLSGKVLLIFQLVVAIIVVLTGTVVVSVQFAGLEPISLSTWLDTKLLLGNLSLILILPAAIISVIWIVGIINAINWVDGLDGLSGSISLISAAALLIVYLNTVNSDIPKVLSTWLAVYIGAVLGVLVFNYNPAKIFFGTIGSFANGFLLAVFAIQGRGKLAAAIIILGLPILDAILVVLLRLKAHPEVRKNPLLLLSISDKNHLHHRLLDVGYSKKTVLFIEVGMMLVLSVIALYFNGFGNNLPFLALATMVVVMTTIFILIAIARRRAQRIAERMRIQEASKPKVEVKFVEKKEHDPEQKYAY